MPNSTLEQLQSKFPQLEWAIKRVNSNPIWAGVKTHHRSLFVIHAWEYLGGSENPVRGDWRSSLRLGNSEDCLAHSRGDTAVSSVNNLLLRVKQLQIGLASIQEQNNA